MNIQTILALVNVILLIVSIMKNGGLFITNMTDTIIANVGIYNIKTITNIENVLKIKSTIPVNCLANGSYKTSTVELDGSPLGFCKTIQILAPIILCFNIFLSIFSELLEMKILKNTTTLLMLIKLLFITTICMNIALLVIIYLQMFELRQSFNNISKINKKNVQTQPEVIFYLICVSLVISLISFIAYLRQPIKSVLKK